MNFVNHISRRAFLLTLGGAGIAIIGRAIAWQGANSRQAAVVVEIDDLLSKLATLTDSKYTNALRALHKPESLPIIRQELSAQISKHVDEWSPFGIKLALDKLIRHDFSDRRTVLVDNWLLSRTEAQIYLLASGSLAI